MAADVHESASGPVTGCSFHRAGTGDVDPASRSNTGSTTEACRPPAQRADHATASAAGTRRASSQVKLPEADRSAAFTEPLRPLHEQGQRGARISQPLDVGQEPARLDRKDEVVRDGARPGPERRRAGQPVEGAVQLDRWKPRRVEGQPLARRHIRRVEAAPPVTVHVAARADEEPVGGWPVRGGSGLIASFTPW